MKPSRIQVTVLALVFAGAGLAFWFAPQRMGQIFDIEAIGPGGLSTLRADLGGLFLGMALAVLWGLRTKRAPALVAIATVLATIATGRLIALVVNGPTPSLLPSLGVELIAVAALVVCSRRLGEQDARQPWSIGRRRMFGGAVGFAGVAGIGIIALQMPSVQQGIFDRAAAKLTAKSNTAPLTDDALRVAICGSSAPLASTQRAKACVAVFAGGKYYLVDVGPESVENLVLWNIPLASIGGVLLTHYHSDHIGDLGELNLQTWAQGRPAPLAVYGGPGIEEVVEGFNRAYRLDQGYRTAHHSAKMMPPDTWPMVPHTVGLDGPATPEKSRTGLVLDDGELRITAIEVEHAPIEPAYAYRFDYRGRSVVVTGDTKYHPPLAVASKDADILVSEAIARSMIASLQGGATESGRDRVAKIMHDVQDYHISPEEAATIANDANVKLLVFYHLLPAPDASLTRRIFSRGVDRVRHGRWDLADDGSLYTLPLGSEQVLIGKIES